MNTNGNDNIIIQDIKDSTITISVNGDIQEIRNELGELKQLIKNMKGQTIQYAGKIYNIDSIDQANFTVNYPDGRQIKRYLTMPPFASDFFIGREQDLEAIEEEYQQKSRLLVLVNGEGGIGKTTLTAKYWYKHAERYKHLAWLYADTGIGKALVTLKDKLGVEFEQIDTLETQVQRITEAINNLDAPCLLVFDNANDDADLKKYYTVLKRLANCHILLTSRVNKLDELKVHRIAPLTEAESIALFKHYYPTVADNELPLLKDVLKAVGYNTLVTEVLAKNMAVFNKYTQKYSLTDLLQDLQAKGLLALKNKAITIVYGSDSLREAEPTDIIAAMYDLAKLNDAERYLLSNLSVLPAENIAYTLLESLLGLEEDTLGDALSSLETKGWIEYRKEDSSFKISPVVQEVVRVKNESNLLSDCRKLVNGLTIGLNEDNRHADNYQLASVLAYLGSSLIDVLPTDDDIATLCQNIGNYHRDTGNLTLMLQAYQKMVDIQTALCTAEPNNADFKNGLAISYQYLGSTHTALGNLDKALGFFEDYNKLEQELYKAYPNNVEFKNNLAISYEKLGSTHTALGNLDKALGFFEEYNKLEQELYKAYPNNISFKNGLAISYEKLGSTHTALGNLDKALGFFEEYNKLEQELYKAYPNNVSFKNAWAISYQDLGSTHAALGNLDKALGFFGEYNKLEQELYKAYPNNVSFKNALAISYQYLGNTHTELGNLDKALGFFEEYNKLEQELCKVYPNNISFKNALAISCSRLGSTHKALGNLNKALGFFEEYNKLEQELYKVYPNNISFKNSLAISYQYLGSTHTALGNLNKALGFFEECNKLEQELYKAYPNNIEFKNNLAISYSKLGETHTELGNLDKALVFFEEYNKLEQELYKAYPNNVSFKNSLALSYQWLGYFLETKKDNKEKAKEYYQNSEKLLKELVQSFPNYVSFQKNLTWVKDKLAKL